jgi:hypothetical protein
LQCFFIQQHLQEAQTHFTPHFSGFLSHFALQSAKQICFPSGVQLHPFAGRVRRWMNFAGLASNSDLHPIQQK